MKAYTKKEKYHEKVLNFLVKFLFRRHYIGFYFWNNKGDVRQKIIEVITGKILALLAVCLIGIIFTIIVIFNLNEKIPITPNKESKLLFLGSIAIIAYLLSNKLENYIRKIITDTYIKTINLKKYSKKSALPYFITTFTDLFIILCVLVLMMKLFSILK